MSEQEEDLEDDEQEEPPGDEENAPSQNTPDTKAHWEHLALRELTEEERRLVVASAMALAARRPRCRSLGGSTPPANGKRLSLCTPATGCMGPRSS